jgi:hypothetical protein
MTEPDINRLHEKIQHLEEQRLERIEASIDEIIANQRRMERQLERYSARWGFILMVGSASLAAIKFFWQDVMKLFGK